MKKIIPIFLIAVLALQYFNKIEIYLSYRIHKNYISTFLCENRNRPQLKCFGNCHLLKQLCTTEETQKKSPASVKDFQEIVYFFSDEKTVWKIFSTENPLMPFLQNEKSILLYSPIFHPPQII
ncbi:MAG: hypothetical protein ACHQK8_01160 [Bacteroidia bacterium]